MILFSVKLWVLFSAVSVVKGTLIPDGTVPLDCGSRQTFTCSVTGVSSVWNISGLNGIDTGVAGSSGLPLANSNARITTTDTSGVTQSSTINITAFTTTDNGGTIQCINLADGSVQGMATISVEHPSCPTSFSANRDGDFTSANVTYELATPPPVVSTTVTYCRTSSSSSPNCGNMSCPPSNGTCTISGLDPCEEYSLTAIPNNNCGNATGCTWNNMIVASQDVPSCPNMLKLKHLFSEDICSVNLTWEQPSNTSSPVTSTRVTYSGYNVTCTSPCHIDSGLVNGTEYNFTVIPENNCGSRTRCSMNTATVTSNCTTKESTNSTAPTTLLVAAIAGGVVGGLAGVGIGALVIYAITVLIAVLCCSSCEGRSYCHVFFCQYCCGGESKRPSSTRPMPAEEYVDPKKVREKKEKEDKIQYAALEFSEQAGSSGEKPIRSKEEPVQYLAVEQA